MLMTKSVFIDNVLREELEQARQLIISHIHANGQNASGRTIASMHVEIDGDGGTLYGRNYFGVLETGRKPGRVPRSFASIIRQWMEDKGLHGTPIPYKADRPHKYTPQERGDMSMAAAIAHTIKTKGTRLHRTGGRDDVYSNVVPGTIARVRQRILEHIKTEAQHIELNSTSI